MLPSQLLGNWPTGQLGNKVRHYLKKQSKAKRDRGMTQMVEHLLARQKTEFKEQHWFEQRKKKE
jgi:hypothetical protein